MGSQPTIEIIEFQLQEFCESCLELLSGQAARGSVLTDLLPSFPRSLEACGQVIDHVTKEFDSWKQKSQQLVRLAALHCGTDSSGLIAGLERISQESTRVISALECLMGKPDGDVIALSDIAESTVTDSDETTYVNPFDYHLKRFCTAVLVLLHAGPNDSSVLAQTMPSLYAMFAACGTVTLAQLRAELNVSRTTTEQLLQFADAHCDQALNRLEERVRQAQDCAERLISAVESLAWSAPSVVRKTSGLTTGSSDGVIESSPTESAATESDSAEAQRLYHLAIQSHQRQDFRTAETLYSEAIRLDSNLRLAWLQRGRIRMLNSNAHLAVADLTQSIRLFAADPLALRWRGDALAICGHFDASLKDYDHSLKIIPESTIVRYNRAVVLRMMGRLESAWSEFEKFLEQRTNRAGAHLNRGLICLSRGDSEKAILEFEAALAIQPGLPEAIERLSQLGVDVALAKASKPTPTAKFRPLKKGNPKPAESHRKSVTDPRPSASDIRHTQELPVEVVAESPDNMSDADLDNLAIAVLSDSEPDHESQGESQSSRTEVSKADSMATKVSTAATVPVTSALPSGAERSAAEMAAALATRTARTEILQPAQTSIEVRCPGCHGLNYIRWERLQPGKAMSCRRCSCHFAVQEDGTLVQMVRNRRGQWSQFRNRFAIGTDRRIVAVIAAVAVLMAIMWLRPQSYDNRIPEDPGYPTELEPRAKLFTLAWLKGDFRTMRQLTDEVQSQELHLWAMDNPAPVIAFPATLERDATFNVQIVNATPPNARVQVHIDGLRIQRGQPVSDLAQNWRQDGERWIFQPVGRSNL